MLDVVTALLVVTGALNAGLFVFVIRGNRHNPINFSFGVFVLCLSVWSLLHVGFRTTGSDAVATELLKLSYVCALLIGASFYYFSIVFPYGERPGVVHSAALSVITILFAFALLTPGFLISSVLHEAYGRSVILRMGDYLAFTGLFCSLFLGGQIRIWLKFRTAVKAARVQLLTIGLSVTAIGFIAMYFDLVLPSPFLDDFQYVWTGPVLTSLFAVTITYAIFRYQLFKLKAALTEALVFAWWMLIVVRCLAENSFLNFFFDQVLLVISAPIGALLLGSLQTEERARETFANVNDR